MTNSSPNILDALTQRGVLINVNGRCWRARKQLRPEDLGLDPDTVDDRLFSLGHKRLLPKEALQKLALVESRAHALVEASTFPHLVSRIDQTTNQGLRSTRHNNTPQKHSSQRPIPLSTTMAEDAPATSARATFYRFGLRISRS